ncbi:hypothetical protein FB451DRAFT_1400719 [Mycena latifolia]|nr:hypothetical protein FB451DRAFT_1400719 [Mycena latifolia]
MHVPVLEQRGSRFMGRGSLSGPSVPLRRRGAALCATRGPLSTPFVARGSREDLRRRARPGAARAAYRVWACAINVPARVPPCSALPVAGLTVHFPCLALTRFRARMSVPPCPPRCAFCVVRALRITHVPAHRSRSSAELCAARCACAMCEARYTRSSPPVLGLRFGSRSSRVFMPVPRALVPAVLAQAETRARGFAGGGGARL